MTRAFLLGMPCDAQLVQQRSRRSRRRAPGNAAGQRRELIRAPPASHARASPKPPYISLNVSLSQLGGLRLTRRLRGPVSGASHGFALRFVLVCINHRLRLLAAIRAIWTTRTGPIHRDWVAAKEPEPARGSVSEILKRAGAWLTSPVQPCVSRSGLVPRESRPTVKPVMVEAVL